MPSNQQFTTQPDAPTRLDAQMQQQVIARALELQSRHQNTVSAEQLEAVAAEAGIDPAFVRQAIAEVVSASPVTHTQAANMPTRKRKWNATVNHEALRTVAWTVPALCMEFAFGNDPSGMVLLGPLVSLGLGAALGRKKRGFALGAALGAADIWGYNCRTTIYSVGYDILAYLFLAGVSGGAYLLGAKLRSVTRSWSFPADTPNSDTN